MPGVLTPVIKCVEKDEYPDKSEKTGYTPTSEVRVSTDGEHRFRPHGEAWVTGIQGMALKRAALLV